MLKNKISLILDILIVIYFLLCFVVLFLGGFQIFVYGMKISVTSIHKPALTLFILVLLKVFIANFKVESEKIKVLLYSTVLLIFCLGEAGARIYYSLFTPQDLYWAAENLVLDRKHGPHGLDSIDTVKVAGNKKIGYELRPNLSGGYLVQGFKTNGHGFRDEREFEYEKDESMIRIVGLGDSVMFGWGVHFTETYGEVLERELNQFSEEKNSIPKVEFINMAVAGYNTTSEVETFFKKGLKFFPDIVIISYVDNDFDLPHYLIRKENPWFSAKSFLGFYILKRMDILARSISMDPDNAFWRNEMRDLGIYNLLNQSSYKNVPEEYRFMVGESAYAREMERLKEKCDELQIPVIMSFDAMIEGREERNNFAVQTAESLGIPVVTDIEEVERILREQGLGRLDFQNSHRDPHPNSRRHEIKGKLLASYIIESVLTASRPLTSR